MPAKKEKPNITRKNLELHEIYYNDEFDRLQFHKLPEHVDIVRETLLSFDACLPGSIRLTGGYKQTLHQEFTLHKRANNLANNLGLDIQPPDKAWIKPQPHESMREDRTPEWNAAKIDLDQCVKVATYVRRLKAESENTWNTFWQANIFTKTSERFRELPGFQ